jgi:predicted glycosyltransferase
MKILFYFGHPAQYLFLRETIKAIISNGNSVKILIKTKDVLEELLLQDRLEYVNILPQERGNSKIAIAFSLIKRNIALLPIILKFRPNLMIGTDATIAQLGWLLRINRITITEDDYDLIKTLGDLSYPFTKTILCPEVCAVGKWEHKKIGYAGYMKLGYLHPNVFKRDPKIPEKYNLLKKYAVIRLAKLTAHHDFGIKGIDESFLDKIISVFEKHSIAVFISAEGRIAEKYRKHLFNINPNDMHQILANAEFLICDSQSMSVEASMLGVPSIRFSSFAGRVSVLEELEHTYQLTFGVHPSRPHELFKKLEELLSNIDLNADFQHRRKKMLADKIDVTSFLVWFIENHPESVHTMKENPDYQYKFR